MKKEGLGVRQGEDSGDGGWGAGTIVRIKTAPIPSKQSWSSPTCHLPPLVWRGRVLAIIFRVESDDKEWPAKRQTVNQLQDDPRTRKSEARPAEESSQQRSQPAGLPPPNEGMARCPLTPPEQESIHRPRTPTWAGNASWIGIYIS